MIGTNPIKTHQPDLLRSCQRLIEMASDGQMIRRKKMEAMNHRNPEFTPTAIIATIHDTPHRTMPAAQNFARLIRPSKLKSNQA